jgi:hypothetical protein
MGRILDLFARLGRRIDRPADQSVLTHTDRDGSERMIEADDEQKASSAAGTVRRTRDRRRRRWLRLGGF